MPADLATDDPSGALRTAGLSSTEPAMFVVEGLTMYLTHPQVRTLFATLATLAAAGSRLVTNFGVGFTSNPTTGPGGLVRRALLAVRGEPFRYQPDPDQARCLLAETGWSVTELVTGPDLAARHLAGVGLPTGLNPAAFVVTATLEAQS